MAIILETGTNKTKNSEPCHDEFIIDREYKIKNKDKEEREKNVLH